MLNCLYSYLEKYDIRIYKTSIRIQQRLSAVYINLRSFSKKTSMMACIHVAFVLDLAKAFNSVKHTKLLDKMLRLFVIRGIAKQTCLKVAYRIEKKTQKYLTVSVTCLK